MFRFIFGNVVYDPSLEVSSSFVDILYLLLHHNNLISSSLVIYSEDFFLSICFFIFHQCCDYRSLYLPSGEYKVSGSLKLWLLPLSSFMFHKIVPIFLTSLLFPPKPFILTTWSLSGSTKSSILLVKYDDAQLLI